MPDTEMDGLRRLLAYKMLGYEELNGSESEASQIDFLCEIVRGYFYSGDYELEDVVAAFKRYPVPGFDILLWIESNGDD